MVLGLFFLSWDTLSQGEKVGGYLPSVHRGFSPASTPEVALTSSGIKVGVPDKHQRHVNDGRHLKFKKKFKFQLANSEIQVGLV